MKKVLMSIFIVAIMVLSAFGFVLNYSDTSNTAKHNGYKFVKTNKGWRTYFNNNPVYFNYLPGELEFFNIPEDVKNKLKDVKLLYVTFDPNSSIAHSMAQAQFNLEQQLNWNTDSFVMRGLIKNTNTGLPVITCINATQFTPVIFLKEANTSSVNLENNCIIVSADESNQLGIAEKIIYILFRVIQ